MSRGTGGNHAFYLSIPPSAFPVVCKQLARSGLSQPEEGTWRRVVIEKPFGHDLASARELNDIVSSVFRPDDIFRIDHYLGKETVQNLLALRFANQLFEPIWNANYVDHVQITMAEDIGIGGRAGYYDGIGAARDVIQNHLLQLLALTAMEEPASFDADEPARREDQGPLGRQAAPRPRQAHRPRPVRGRAGRAARRSSATSRRRASTRSSTTETFAAIRVDIDNRRWAGVPFYLRTGKRLGRRVTEIAVVFKQAPHLPFESTATEELGKNALVIRVQPDEGVTLRFGAKVPGTAMEVRDVTMDFGYGHAFTESSPEAYERLILDVLLGDPPLFPRHEEVELSWKVLDPITAYWAAQGQARAVPLGHLGPRVGRRDDGARRARLEAAMIIELPDTTTRDINKRLLKERDEGGAIALGRVLTLIISVGRPRPGRGDRRRERRQPRAPVPRHRDRERHQRTGRRRSTPRSGSAATRAPARCIVLRPSGALERHLDTLVIPLLLPDAPIVTWWPYEIPDNVAEAPARPHGAAADHRHDAGRPPHRRAAQARARPTSTATPTWPGRARRCGAGSSPRRSTSRRTSPCARPSSSARARTRRST